jgi:ketosteroid isomerase-like protein
VRGAEAPVPDPDTGRQREVVDAFFAAARHGDFDALVAVLDPDVVLRVDAGTGRPDASARVRGAAAVAGQALMFDQPAAAVQAALVNGAAGAVVTVSGQPFAVMAFTVSRGRIAEIDILADPERLLRLNLAVSGGPAPEAAWARLGAEPGLCLTCRHAKLNETRRGTAYLRCGRSAWDDRLVRYPRLPVIECAGFEARETGPVLRS